MASHKEHAKNERHAEKRAERDRLADEEGRISGIRKPKHRLRRLKLAAKTAVATVAIAAGLAAAAVPSTASAKSMASLRGATDISSSFVMQKDKEPGEYVVNLPDEFEEFSKGQSAKGRLDALSKSMLFQRNFSELRSGAFALKTSGGEVAFIVENPRVLVFGDGKNLSFTLDISQYGMEGPVPRLEETKDGKVVLHIIDVATGTDLTLAFNIYSPSAERMKAKAYREGGPAARSALVSRGIQEIVRAGEELLESQDPKTIEEARDAYAEMGAEMVNRLREKCEALPPAEAEELANRGQAVIAAVMLRLYVSDDEAALMEIDRLRADPGLTKGRLEVFARSNGIYEEFRKIWPQCGIENDYE